MWFFDLFIHKPLKRQAKFVADNILKLLFIFFFSEKISLDRWFTWNGKTLLYEKENKNYFFSATIVIDGSVNLICRGTVILYFRETLELQNNQSQV